MNGVNNAKLAVTIYSFTKEYYEGHYSLEDCVAKAVEMGAEGIEIVNTQHIVGFPNPTNEFIEYFVSLMKKYNVKPVSYGTYTDTGIRKDGKLTITEMTNQLLVDIELADKLGFPLIRVGPNTPFSVLEDVLVEAEKRNIKLGIEIHAPISVSDPMIKGIVSKIKEMKSDYIGFVPDFSCFALSVPNVLIQQAIEKGVPKEAAAFIANGYKEGVSIVQLKEIAHSNGFPKEMDELIDLFYHLVVRGTPNELAEIMPYVNHVHAKFWDLNENDDEENVPYKELLDVIAASGYKGYISSEYEGYHADENYRGYSITKRHQQMMKRYLGL